MPFAPFVASDRSVRRPELQDVAIALTNVNALRRAAGGVDRTSGSSTEPQWVPSNGFA